MDIWSTDKLVLFLLFVVPGFVCLKTYQVLVPNRSRTSSQQLIDALAFSCINYALLALPILLVDETGLRTTWPKAYAVFWGFVLLGAPVLWAAVFFVFRRWRWARRFLPHPTEAAWDFVFALPRHVWVVVTLTDGRKVGGLYAGNSFASSAPCSEQLYLEECWDINLDGGLERPRTETAGLLVLASSIQSLEFFHVTRGTHHEPRAEACTDTGTARLPATAPTASQ